MQNHGSKFFEKILFLKRFISAPSQVGSITPSSRYLMREMLSEVDWDTSHSIAELGAGTGVFTGKISEKMNDGHLMVFEIDDALRTMIKTPDGHKTKITLHSNAEDLPDVMRSFGFEQVDCILSSLPFTVLPAGVSDKILSGVAECLKPDGKFVAYQYSQIMRKEFERRFKHVKISFVLRNIPPAFVYVCKNPV